MSDFGPTFVRFAYSILPVITVAANAFVGYWVYTNYWDSEKARYFLPVLVAGSLWNAAVLGSVLATAPGVQRAFDAAVPVAGALTIVTWVVFTGKYTGTDYHRKPVVRTACAVLLGGTVALVLTNSQLSLLYTDRQFVTEPFTYGVYDSAAGGIALLTLTSVLAVYAYYELVRHFLSAERHGRWQLVFLLLGALSVAVAQLLGRTGLVPAPGFDHSAYGTLPFIVFTSVALFRFRLFDVQPVARNTVVERLQDPMLVLDDRQRVVDYNEAATHVWDGLAGNTPATLGTVCPALAETLASPDGDGGNLTLPYDDRDRHFSVTVSAADGDAGGDWQAVLLRDVTELERSRWQLQKQNERLDRVASTISHDLRNPINVATGQIELMEAHLDDADIEGASAAKLRDSLAEVDGATDRMQAIIDDVLTIAREGSVVEETEKLALGDVAREAWGNVDTGDATLTVADDRTVRADRSKLLTVFENLFRNSVEHGGSGTTVEVVATDDGFCVADDGPGVPEEHRDSVFEHGYTTDDEGTGLGLAIVRTMAESHGWTVSLDADRGSGACVRFRGVEVGPAAGPRLWEV